jgi:hypothetical protein
MPRSIIIELTTLVVIATHFTYIFKSTTRSRPQRSLKIVISLICLLELRVAVDGDITVRIYLRIEHDSIWFSHSQPYF